MKRRIKKTELTTAHKQIDNNLIEMIDTGVTVDFETEEANNVINTSDKECQVNFLLSDYEEGKTFTCNTYANHTGFRDVEIQTEIQESIIVRVPNQKQFKDKQCGTEKIFVDRAAPAHWVHPMLRMSRKQTIFLASHL